jgi:tetratricopeptide (TPR) repeat protein
MKKLPPALRAFAFASAFACALASAPPSAFAQSYQANEKITADNETVARTFKAGNEALIAGRHDEAIDAYGEGLAVRPDEPGLLINLAEAKRRRGVARFNAALRSKDAQAQEASRKDWGEAAEHARRAVELLKASTPADPNAQAAHRMNLTAALNTRAEAMRLVATKVDRSQADDALAAYVEYVAVTEDPARKSKLRADVLKMLFDAEAYERAAAESRKALGVEPDNLNAHLFLGLSLFATNDKAMLQEAADHISLFVERAPDADPMKPDAQATLDFLRTNENITPKRAGQAGTTPR